MIDYEKEVRQVYPNVYLRVVVNNWTERLAIGCHVIAPCGIRIFGGAIVPFYRRKIGYGFTADLAFISAYYKLVVEGKIKPL